MKSRDISASILDSMASYKYKNNVMFGPIHAHLMSSAAWILIWLERYFLD